jgi:hypothetical protein
MLVACNYPSCSPTQALHIRELAKELSELQSSSIRKHRKVLPEPQDVRWRIDRYLCYSSDKTNGISLYWRPNAHIKVICLAKVNFVAGGARLSAFGPAVFVIGAKKLLMVSFFFIDRLLINTMVGEMVFQRTHRSFTAVAVKYETHQKDVCQSQINILT